MSGRDSLKDRSARRRSRYIYNTQQKHNRRTSMASAGCETATLANKQLTATP